MKNFWNILLLAGLAFGGVEARSQDTPAQPDTGTPTTQQAPVPAYGQDNTQPAPANENPPLSGLDLPSLEPHAAPLSYLQARASASESVDTNIANALGPGETNSVSRAYGSLTLQRLWRHYDLGLDYLGGAGYYNSAGQGWKNFQQLDLAQKFSWRRGSLSVRDSFSYLPEGNFGGAYGSLGTEGIASLGATGVSSFWGGSGLGALGQVPRVLNISLAEIDQGLSPKSEITAIGGYAFTHFYGAGFSQSPFIGSSQVSVQAAYNRVLTSHTQLALVYGYEGFDFSVLGTAFHAHLIEGLYGHRISGRMDLLLGGGPQITFIDTPAAVCSNAEIPVLFCQAFGYTLSTSIQKETRIEAAAQARLRYQLPKWSLALSFERFETSGSGIFAGAESNIVRLQGTRPLSRVWNMFLDIGYTHNSRIQPLTVAQVEACTGAEGGTSQNACPASEATSYNYGFLGGGIHRMFGRNFHAFVSYQFNEFSYDSSFCQGTAACNRISNRQIATIGLDWTPRPIRLD
jgi:hypothetical protein